MKTWKKIQLTMALVSCLGFVLPSSVIAAAPGAFAQDVAMNQGAFNGKVMSTSGTSVAGAKVFVLRAGAKVAEATTDVNGAFAVPNLKGGVYQVAAAGNASQFRLWADQTAPPSAAKSALLVANAEVVRGQCCDTNCGCGAMDGCTVPSYDVCGCGGGGCAGCGGCGGKSMLPWLLAAGVAAAIAIPLALDDDDAS